MNINELVSCLEPYQTSIDDVDFQGVFRRVSNVSDREEVKGRLAEQLMFQWIDSCPDVELAGVSGRRFGEYRCVLRPGGICLEKNGRRVVEYDFVVDFDGELTVIEVKSLKLNGISERIPRILEYGSVFTGEEVGLVVAFPMYTNKAADAKILERRFPNVKCLDTGYKKKQLLRGVDAFYRSLS